MAEARSTLAAFLYPKDAVKSLEYFEDSERVLRNCNMIQEILYHFSNEKMNALLQLDGFRAILEFYQREGTSQIDADTEKALKLVLSDKFKY